MTSIWIWDKTMKTPMEIDSHFSQNHHLFEMCNHAIFSASDFFSCSFILEEADKVISNFMWSEDQTITPAAKANALCARTDDAECVYNILLL